MKKWTAAALSVVGLIAFAYAVKVYAYPSNEEGWYYYNGCGSNMVEVGHDITFCSGYQNVSGDQDGHWLAYTNMDCETTYAYSEFYEKCNGQWQSRTAAQWGVCSCS